MIAIDECAPYFIPITELEKGCKREKERERERDSRATAAGPTLELFSNTGVSNTVISNTVVQIL